MEALALNAFPFREKAGIEVECSFPLRGKGL
jgi:hypothetical protein